MIQIDMPMPDNCDECRFNTEYAFCKAMPDNFCRNTNGRKRPEWCPLKEQEAKTVIVDRHKVLHDDSYDEARFFEDVFYHCPSCNKILSRTHKKPRIGFCDECGQAVKWE